MSRPKRKIPQELIAKYQTGAYNVSELSRSYNIPRTTILDFIKQNNIRISDNAKNAINYLNSGFQEVQKIVSDRVSDSVIVNPNLVVNSIIEDVKRNNPIVANKIQELSLNILQTCEVFLKSGVDETRDLKNITSAIKDINDTLQVIPKPPAIAQQFNFSNQEKERETKKIIEKFEIEFIENENQDK